jgi:transposase
MNTEKGRRGRPPMALDLARAIALRDAGYSLRDIAKELGVGVMTVQRRLEDVTPELLRNVPALPMT